MSLLAKPSSQRGGGVVYTERWLATSAPSWRDRVSFRGTGASVEQGRDRARAKRGREETRWELEISS